MAQQHASTMMHAMYVYHTLCGISSLQLRYEERFATRTSSMFMHPELAVLDENLGETRVLQKGEKVHIPLLR